MHPNPIYHTGTRDDCVHMARDIGFGVLAVSAGDAAPMLSHVPFVLSKDGQSAELHLVRSNPIARAMVRDGLAARIAVQGAHSYISPDWYGIDDQVPTWNYVAVHLVGRLMPVDSTELPAMLDRLSDQFEDRLRPKPVWKSSKMPQDAMEKLLRAIVPFRFDIQQVDGTFKLGQNKPESARVGAANGAEAAGIGSDVARLAAMMRDL